MAIGDGYTYGWEWPLGARVTTTSTTGAGDPGLGTGFVTWPTVTGFIPAPRTEAARHGWKCPECHLILAPWVPEHECRDTSGDTEQVELPILNKGIQAAPGDCQVCADLGIVAKDHHPVEDHDQQ